MLSAFVSSLTLIGRTSLTESNANKISSCIGITFIVSSSLLFNVEVEVSIETTEVFEPFTTESYAIVAVLCSGLLYVLNVFMT